MADPKHAALHFPQAGSERNVELVQRDLSETIGIVTERQDDRRQGIRVFARIQGKKVESPMPNRGSRGLAVTAMPGEHGLQTFLQ